MSNLLSFFLSSTTCWGAPPVFSSSEGVQPPPTVSLGIMLHGLWVGRVLLELSPEVEFVVFVVGVVGSLGVVEFVVLVDGSTGEIGVGGGGVGVGGGGVGSGVGIGVGLIDSL